MARPRKRDALRHALETRFGDDAWAYLSTKDSFSGAVRDAVAVASLVARGDAFLVDGAAARALRQVARDLDTDPATTILMGTYLIALFAQMAPRLEGEVARMVERVRAQATRASVGPDQLGRGGAGRTPRSG